jgi:hypothetical protein
VFFQHRAPDHTGRKEIPASEKVVGLPEKAVEGFREHEILDSDQQAILDGFADRFQRPEHPLDGPRLIRVLIEDIFPRLGSGTEHADEVRATSVPLGEWLQLNASGPRAAVRNPGMSGVELRGENFLTLFEEPVNRF